VQNYITSYALSFTTFTLKSVHVIWPTLCSLLSQSDTLRFARSLWNNQLHVHHTSAVHQVWRARFLFVGPSVIELSPCWTIRTISDL